MNRKNLVITFVLLSAILLVSPFIGSVSACNNERQGSKFQTFAVAGSYSFLDTLNADHHYYPSEANQKKLVISQEENMLTYEITVGGITYKLGQDFTYSGHAVYTFFDPVYDLTLGPPLYPSGFSSEKLRIVYMYDFSAVPGGLCGTIRMIATLKDNVLSIRSTGGTGDFRNVKIEATASSTFEPPYTVNIFHEGKVCGWPCVFSTSQPSAQVVTYDELTTLCLGAGLSGNPYPAPTTPSTVGPDANGNMYIHDTEYRTFTQVIGDVVYQGVSYDPFDMTINIFTGDGQMVYRAVWYLGDLGRTHNGFFGPITVDLFGYGTGGYYYTANMMLQGFGHFTHQSLVLTADTRVPEVPSGYCLVQGNRCK